MKSAKIFFILILIILSYPFLIKYVYVQHNQFEQIPLILRFLNSKYLIQDWSINLNTQFSPRYFYILYIGIIGKFLSLPLAYFINYLIMVSLITFSSYFVAKRLFKSTFISILTTIFILFGQKYTLGSNDLIGRDFDPSRLAFGLVLTAFVFVLKENYILSAILFSLSTYLHPLIGLEVPVIFYSSYFIYIYIDKRNEAPRAYARGILKFFGERNPPKHYPSTLLRQAQDSLRVSAISHSSTSLHSWFSAKADKDRIYPLLKSLVIYLLISSYAIYNYLISYQNQRIDKTSQDELFTIIGHVRSPHHYLPLTWNFDVYIKFGIFLILFMIFYKYYYEEFDPKYRKVFNIIILQISILCFLSFVFTQLIPIYSILILQLFRMTVIVYWIFAIIIYSACIKLSLYSKLHSKFKIVIAFIPFFITTFSSTLLSSRSYIFFLVISVIISLLIIKANNRIIKLFIIILILLNFSILHRHFKFEFKQNYPYETKETQLAQWIKNNTPSDSIFLTPPDFYAFRLNAERAIIVDWLVIPFEEKGITEWIQRIKNVSGLENEPNKNISEYKVLTGYKKIDDKRLSYLRSLYNFQYVISENTFPLNLKIVYRNELYTLYEI